MPLDLDVPAQGEGDFGNAARILRLSGPVIIPGICICDLTDLVK